MAEKEGPPEKRDEKIEAFRQYANFGAIGIYFGVSIAIGLLFGYLIDKKLGTEPIFLLIFLFLGIATGFINLARIAKRLSHQSDQEGKGSP